MNAPLPRGAFALLLAVSGAAPLGAQSDTPDLVAPPVREKIVADAARVIAAREQAAVLPAPLPNPFIAKEREVQVLDQAVTAITPSLGGTDLLARLATRIPATGTMSIGGAPILLLGQKRLKVGEAYPISFEGKTYEVSIEAVTSTSFTVRRGDDLHTRPVHMPASSALPSTTRP